jgi:RNA-directed DNA polymerase
MTDKRQKNRKQTAYIRKGTGEARTPGVEGFESVMVIGEIGIPVPEQLMEEIADVRNLKEAYFRVRSNKGSAGIDKMTVEELGGYLLRHYDEISQQLLQGTFKPQPVRRVEIPKSTGGTRKLGIPCAIDRLIQQALLQVVQKYWDSTFSEHSYGFRPGRSQHQAIEQAQKYVCSGLQYVVDLDLEKFFDKVNQDILMGLVAKRLKDKRVLKLIRAFLNAGIMENGVVQPQAEGVPQGGPLSPWLSNVMLDELDRELEKRKLNFIRWADDCNIYVGSERAGKRVMESITSFLSKRLKLKVNTEKSAVGRPWERKFLGFTFLRRESLRRRIAPQALERAKTKIRELTRRKRGGTLEQIVEELARYLNGWIGYFGYGEVKSDVESLEKWVRHRLRSLIWKRWKTSKRRLSELRKRDVNEGLARRTAGSSKGAWHLSNSKALSYALPNKFFRSLGLPDLLSRVSSVGQTT